MKAPATKTTAKSPKRPRGASTRFALQFMGYFLAFDRLPLPQDAK